MALHASLMSTLAVQASAVWLAGVNIAGCEIGMDQLGNYAPSDFESQYGCPSEDMARSQMQHFADVDNFNVFRLPVPWQKLVGNNLEVNQLDGDYFDQYNRLVQICLDMSAEAHCIIDIHNYGRWWGGIIGQDGPSANDLAKTWSQIAAHWSYEPRIIFGTMNEPHDTIIDNVNQEDFNQDIWTATSQTVVNAIRDAGATSQIILLSPSHFANAIDFQYSTHEALLTVSDPTDASNENLIFELHQYFDMAGGTTKVCNDTLADKFNDLAGFLRSNSRKAFIGELGSGSGPDCVGIVCPVLDVLNDNGDVFVGWTAWAAGNWWSDYELSLVPTNGVDVGIMQSCFGPKFSS